MIRFGLKNFLRFCRANALFSILSFLCLVSAFGNFLFIQQRAYYMYTANADSNQDTQVLYFTCNDTNTIKSFYEKLVSDPVLPEMETVTVSDENY